MTTPKDIELTVPVSIPVMLIDDAVRDVVKKSFVKSSWPGSPFQRGYDALQEAVAEVIATIDFEEMVREEAARILPQLIENATRAALKGMVKNTITEMYREGSLVGTLQND